MSRDDFAAWARDLAPAAIITIVAAVLVEANVDAGDGALALLVVLGLAAAIIAGVVIEQVHRTDRARRAAPVAAFAPPSVEPTVAPTPSVERPPPDAARAPQSPPPPWERATSAAVGGALNISVQKLGNSAEENEDAFAFDPSIGRVVVADGASSSFASAAWSRSLCDEIVGDPAATTSNEALLGAIVRAAHRWESVVKPDGEVPWYALEGLERGAHATLLVVDVARVDGAVRYRAAAIGDSCVVVLRRASDRWTVVDSFPVRPGSTFGSHPDLVQTKNVGLDGLVWVDGVLAEGDVLAIATDAVSEWVLGATDPIAANALATADAVQLEELWTQRRTDHGMVNDDCTLVRLPPAGQQLR